MMKLAVLATLLSGCFWVTTKSEGKSLRHDVNDLNTRVTSKETEVSRPGT